MNVAIKNPSGYYYNRCDLIKPNKNFSTLPLIQFINLTKIPGKDVKLKKFFCESLPKKN